METTGYPDFKMGSTTALVQTVEFFMATMCAKWPKIDRNVLICIGNVGFQKFHSSFTFCWISLQMGMELVLRNAKRTSFLDF